ncbi:DpnI domain-containing protein [Cribrihabitans sp. XS_ASV171]
MATARQSLGDWGEALITKECTCPSCKRSNTMKKLPPNFKCADLICDFCGYLAQVKTTTVKDADLFPKQILGAAWKPQKDRMEAGIYFPLYVVLATKARDAWRIFFLPADLQPPEMFVPRNPLSGNARRAGWQGYRIDCEVVRERFVKLASWP